MTQIALDHVRQALALRDFDVMAAQRRMAPRPRPLRRNPERPGQPREASVLLLLYPSHGLSFVLELRTHNPQDVHSGQISLPGGACEPGETPWETALREVREELGLWLPVEPLGALSELYIPPSDFLVHPMVGYVDMVPRWRLMESEVQAVLECSLALLLDESAKVDEEWDVRGQRMQVPWYNVQGQKVWGATAIILSEFEQRLRAVLAPRA